MKATLAYGFKRIFDHVTRIRTPARLLVGCGAALLLYEGVWAGFPAARLFWRTDGQEFEISLPDSPATWLSAARLAMALILLLVGGAWAYRDQRINERRASKLRSFVIESRGLTDEQGRSLAATVSEGAQGQVEEALIDLRSFNRDNRVADPDGAVQEIMHVRGDLRRRRAQKDRDDITLVYGGLTAVPFTFLLGALLDDEGPIEVWDWDRTLGCWRELIEEDDGKRFHVAWQSPDHRPKEVVVAISASYPILEDNLIKAFPSRPIMRLDLIGRGQDSHWSAAKQAALATQFLDALKQLEEAGVTTIHLVLAAPRRCGRI